MADKESRRFTINIAEGKEGLFRKGLFELSKKMAAPDGRLYTDDIVLNAIILGCEPMSLSTLVFPKRDSHLNRVVFRQGEKGYLYLCFFCGKIFQGKDEISKHREICAMRLQVASQPAQIQQQPPPPKTDGWGLI